MDYQNKKTALSYLEKYAEKDLESITKLFSEDIVLRDWKIRVEGIEKAISETEKNFNAANTLQIDILSQFENHKTIALELKITINNTEELYVIDIIQFNSEGKICLIKAFRGRGDENN